MRAHDTSAAWQSSWRELLASALALLLVAKIRRERGRKLGIDKPPPVKKDNIGPRQVTSLSHLPPGDLQMA